ncbi:MAG: serine/threonine protein kinase [Deltaproteobacteria bacterium]|nr:serine/threonine protein kinase [Deltaproteobacteria bacterium]
MTKPGESSEVGLSQETLSDAAPARREVERGSTFGRYVVIEPIGRGGMSVVYAAYDPELDRKVALKVLRTSTERPDALARERSRLLREAQAMARLAHPNVVPVYDAGSIADQVFLAMHLVDGQTMGQWLAQPRAWAEIVEYFVYAGRGLAAAHDAGLVHRDFKPDNVLIDRDGRVRVTDFGLARPSGNTEREGLQSTPLTASGRLDRPVTLAGAILGTPAYMAPEQHLALAVDARSDQFSFCVALWEALAGERPFAGGTVGELAFAVTRGEMRSFPRESKVPPRIRAALERGLARDPQQRFATMHELIGALSPPRRRRPVLMLLGAAGLVGIGAAAMGLGHREEPVDPCASAGAAIEGVWNDGRRAELDRRLADHDIEPAARQRALDHLAAFANDWRDFSKAACIAYRDGSESDAAFDARSRCLSRRLADLERRTDRLATSTADTSVDAVIGTYDLIGAQECNDTERLLAHRPLPDDPAQREAALALEADITELQTHWIALEGVTQAQALLARAERVGWPGATADIEVFLARQLIDSGRTDEAAPLLERAAQHAGAARDDDLRVVAWTELAFLLGVMQTRIPEALRLASVVESELVRLGPDTHAPGHLIMLGAVYQSAGDLPRARAAYGEALSLLDGMPGSQSSRRAVLLNNRGTVTLLEGDALAARVDFEAALAIAREIYGDDHPRLSDNYVNICESYLMRGELVEGEASCRHALELVDKPTVSDAPALARALHAVAVLDLHLYGPARARAVASRASERLRATFGEGSFADAAAEELAALVALYDDDAQSARSHASRANDLLSTMGPAYAQARLRPLWILGLVAYQGAEFETALELCDDALATLPPEVDPMSPLRLEPLGCRGATLLALGRTDEAIAPLEQALAVHAKRGGDPLAVAHAEYWLADALFAREPARARALAQSARRHASIVIARAPKFAAMVDAWLEAHA